MHISYIINQKSYEHIEYQLRRHWLTFVPAIVLLIILMLVPVAVYFLINSLFPQVLHGPIIFPIVVLGASTFYLFAYLLFYVRFIEFYLDLWVITNDRIIQIAQRGLFDRMTTELDLYQIQDVTTDVRGFLHTIFHYGDVTVSTAASTETIIFHDIPNPDIIREQLIRFIEEDRKHHPGEVKE